LPAADPSVWFAAGNRNGGHISSMRRNVATKPAD